MNFWPTRSTTGRFLILHVSLTLLSTVPVLSLVYYQTNQALMATYRQRIADRERGMLLHYRHGGIGERICKTYHTYTYKGEVVLKRTYWYEMSYKGAEKLKPQKEEGITDVRWFRKGHIDAIVNNTFPSIMDVLAKMDLFTDKPAPLSE